MTLDKIVSYNRPYTVAELTEIARDFYDRYVDLRVVIYDENNSGWDVTDADKVLTDGEDKFYIEDINDDDYWDIVISASPV